MKEMDYYGKINDLFEFKKREELFKALCYNKLDHFVYFMNENMNKLVELCLMVIFY